MDLELVTLPCLADNYAYLLHDPASGETALVDVPEAAPVLAELSTHGWRLSQILLTHHHDDHIQGVAEVRAATGARVFGAAADAHRLPPLDGALCEGDVVRLGGHEARVIDVSGHTVGHIAYLFDGYAFTGDSLMAGGCGRLFEGSPAQMWDSLQKLNDLPDETWICSGHEYTVANLAFAAGLDRANPALQGRIDKVAKARAAGLATVPSKMSGERATNIFLRASNPALKEVLGMQTLSDAEVFAELRARKNRA
jgi:hydroxyacylglutathione hydrolase